MLLWSRGDEDRINSIFKSEPYAMIQSMLSLILALIFGFVCNARWIYTALSMLVTSVSTLVYYKLQHSFSDIVTSILVALILCLLVYSCYLMELRDKNTYLQMATVQKMNEELKKILINMPEGIVLINEENDQVSLGNIEFFRLFSLQQNCSN